MNQQAPTAITTYPAVVGAYLAAKRNELKLSQGALAEKVGLTASTWSRIESGESALTIEQLAQAAQALSMTPGALLCTIDAITAELNKRGIGTNIERVTVDEILASGSIPLTGAGLSGAVSAATTSALATLGGGAIAAGGAGIAGIGAAFGAVGFPIVGAAAAVYGLTRWITQKEKNEKN